MATLRRIAKTWKVVRIVVGGLALLLLVVVLFSTIGFEKHLDNTLEACVISQSGKVLTCPVVIRGDMTVHPLRPGADYFSTELLGTGIRGININGKPAASELYFDQNHKDLAIGVNEKGTYCMNREGTLLFAEIKADSFFPELKGQRCVLAAPAGNAEEVKNLLDAQSIPQVHEQHFDWLRQRS